MPSKTKKNNFKNRVNNRKRKYSKMHGGQEKQKSFKNLMQYFKNLEHPSKSKVPPSLPSKLTRHKPTVPPKPEIPPKQVEVSGDPYNSNNESNISTIGNENAQAPVEENNDPYASSNKKLETPNTSIEEQTRIQTKLEELRNQGLDPYSNNEEEEKIIKINKKICNRINEFCNLFTSLDKDVYKLQLKRDNYRNVYKKFNNNLPNFIDKIHTNLKESYDTNVKQYVNNCDLIIKNFKNTTLFDDLEYYLRSFFDITTKSEYINYLYDEKLINPLLQEKEKDLKNMTTQSKSRGNYIFILYQKILKINILFNDLMKDYKKKQIENVNSNVNQKIGNLSEYLKKETKNFNETVKSIHDNIIKRYQKYEKYGYFKNNGSYEINESEVKKQYKKRKGKKTRKEKLTNILGKVDPVLYTKKNIAVLKRIQRTRRNSGVSLSNNNLQKESKTNRNSGISLGNELTNESNTNSPYNSVPNFKNKNIYNLPQNLGNEPNNLKKPESVYASIKNIQQNPQNQQNPIYNTILPYMFRPNSRYGSLGKEQKNKGSQQYAQLKRKLPDNLQQYANLKPKKEIVIPVNSQNKKKKGKKSRLQKVKNTARKIKKKLTKKLSRKKKESNK